MSGGQGPVGSMARDRPLGHARHRAREAALQILYQWEIGRVDIAQAVETYWTMEQGAGLDPEHRALARDLAAGTVSDLAKIDPLLSEHAEHWRLERMAVIDRLILRLAVYELLHVPGTPPRVVLSEALELAKTFSGEDAAKFVNGVLDAIYRKLGVLGAGAPGSENLGTGAPGSEK